LKQFLYTDSCEALPGDYSSFDAGKLTEKDCEPVCRISVFFSFVNLSAKLVMMVKQLFLDGHSKQHYLNKIGLLLVQVLLVVNFLKIWL